MKKDARYINDEALINFVVNQSLYELLAQDTFNMQMQRTIRMGDGMLALLHKDWSKIIKSHFETIHNL